MKKADNDIELKFSLELCGPQNYDVKTPAGRACRVLETVKENIISQTFGAMISRAFGDEIQSGQIAPGAHFIVSIEIKDANCLLFWGSLAESESERLMAEIHCGAPPLQLSPGVRSPRVH